MGKYLIGGSAVYDAFLALQLLERGEEVHLYTSQNSLGDDLTRTLRPWIYPDCDVPGGVLSELSEILAVNDSREGPCFFDPRDLKLFFYDRLKEKGVHFHFLHTPCGIPEDGNARFFAASRFYSPSGIPSGTAFYNNEVAGSHGELTVEYHCTTPGQGKKALHFEIMGSRDDRCYLTVPLGREAYRDGTAYTNDLPDIMQEIKETSGMENTSPSRLGSALFPLSASEFHMQENTLSELVRIQTLAALHAERGVPDADCPWPDDMGGLKSSGHYPVIVAGCGTAGAAAMIGAAERADKVLGIEANALPGGTGTVGGINRYYYGNNYGITKRIDDKVLELSGKIADSHTGDAIRPGEYQALAWNVPAKSLALHSLSQEKGGKILYDSRVIHVGLKEDGETFRADSVTVLTPEGPRRFTCDTLLDMTGSGEVALMAGIPCATGNDRGGNIQTHNICRWKKDDNIFVGVNDNPGVLDPETPDDISRVCEVAHGDSDTYDFADYVTPRETRHVKGDYKYTLDDLFSGCLFPDTIALSQTDFDQHGFQESRQARIGLLPYHDKTYRAALPLRSCYSSLVKNLLFAGKAVSAERDASSFFRMQADAQNIAYTLGNVGADWQRTTKDEKLNIGRKLIEQRLLPVSMEEYERGRLDHIPREVEELLKGYTLRELEEELTELIVRRKGGEVDTGQLDSMGRPLGGVKGLAPTLYWKLNRVVWLLGEQAVSKKLSPETIALLVELMEDTGAGPDRKTNSWVHWRRVINYDRIFNLASAAERIGSPRFLKGLEKWLSDPRLSGFCRKKGLDGDRNYPSAYLELRIAEAAASLGSETALGRIREYTGDVRAILRRHAILYNKGLV